MEKVLVQCGVDESLELLDLSARTHKAYADRHGYEMFVVRRRQRPEKSRYYEKFAALHEAFQAYPDGAFLAYLDCDALIVNPEIDLWSGLESVNNAQLAMARWCGAKYFNNGVILARNEAPLRHLIERCDESDSKRGTFKDMAHDEWTIHEELARTSLEVHALDRRWNDHETRPETVIRAWHGCTHSYKVQEMRKAVSAHG